jgi:hypothetical protein
MTCDLCDFLDAAFLAGTRIRLVNGDSVQVCPACLAILRPPPHRILRPPRRYSDGADALAEEWHRMGRRRRRLGPR